MNADTNSVAIASSRTPMDLAFPFQLRMVDTTSVFDSISASKRRQKNPRKKRSRIETDAAGSSVSKLNKYGKKPDPSAPKITPPCSECGKKFWSDKALFGHMRCHPERQWRGINPPISFRRPVSSVSPFSPIADFEGAAIAITEEDQDVAACLIMLANGPNPIDNSRFECSSCKKVFGSHQALGGHRASHKNVKGCFAIAKSDEETDDHSFQNATLFGHFGHERDMNVEDKMSMFLGTEHKCSICMRVFSSGQALGGHKRCHWERVEEKSATEEGFVHLDLNMPPAPLEHDSSFSYSSGLTLDLRLGL